MNATSNVRLKDTYIDVLVKVHVCYQPFHSFCETYYVTEDLND